MMNIKSIQPVMEYEKYAYGSPISRQMLYKLLYTCKSKYKDPFNEIQYIDTDICINKVLLSNNRKELKIPLRCGFDVKRNTIIFLVFSSRYNMIQELEVLKGLLVEFGTLHQELVKAQKAVYWNLSKIDQESISFGGIKPASRDKLIHVANRILNTK
jgi:hypothetical protein